MYKAENALDILIPLGGGVVLLGLLVGFIIYFISLYKKKEVEYKWEREQAKQLALKNEIEIKKQTLSYVSRELHDNLGQIASLIKINLGMVRLNENHEDFDKVNDSRALIKSLIVDIKSLSTTLKGENLQRFGLIDMIKKDLARIEKISLIKTNLQVDNDFPELSSEKTVFLYRMTQEIFNNILQHSSATTAELHILVINKIGIQFKFTDNGNGFNVGTNKPGNGLINLEERCKLINATLEINSDLGKGTEIRISLNNYE